jgi:hypothetical protein
MVITNSFIAAVKSADVTSIRIMMKDSLLVDRTFNEFNQMQSLANNVPGLYDTQNSYEFKRDKSAWDDDYMNLLMAQVMFNFSHERLNHLKEVVNFLYPAASTAPVSSSGQPTTKRAYYDSDDDDPPKSIPKSYKEQKRYDQKRNRIVHHRTAKIAVGAAVGGAVGGFLGGVASVTGASILIGAAVGAVSVGGVVAIVTKPVHTAKNNLYST